MNILQRWKQTTIANKGLVFSSALVAFGTLFYSGAAIVQVRIMKQNAHDASLQADTLIKAAQAEASAANKNAEAAASFALSADGINKQTRAAVAQFQHLADATKRAAEAATQGLADSETRFRIEQRPYLVVRDVVVPELKSLQMGGDARTIAVIDNIGKGIAFNYYGFPVVEIVDLDITQPLHFFEELAKPIDSLFQRDVIERMREVEQAGKPYVPIRDIAPGQWADLGAPLLGNTVTTNNMMGIMFGRSYVVFMGMVKYTSFGETHTTEFCWFMTKPTINDKEPDPTKKVNQQWVLCKDHNTIR